MPADPIDIAAASRDAVVVTWSSAAMAGRYPNARDGSVTPARGIFDLASDAQTIADARGALIGRERRRFAVDVEDVVWPNLAAGVPSVVVADSEQMASGAALVARIEIDLEAGATFYETFG